MRKSMNLNVRLTEPLSDHVAERTGDGGPYDNSSEYVRDLIRRDIDRLEEQAFQRLKAELTRAFAAPDSGYVELTAEDIIARYDSRDGT